ncbi:MAG: hypothetical protein E6J72_08145 [Deltaproteobacteria bacterium]|nr:MAG: hypothetical protein E6J72_08145 [Deltaproteobacteria bacterium]
MNEREREHPTAPTSVVPSWIEVRRGTAPLLLFAPHGARRTLPRRPGRDNVNDLHTADVTRELGTACDATWIVNESRDRNELDLNRTQQVRERAPWLLEFLAATLEEMVAAHGGATLLAVHGWNVVQCVCDLGVGLVEEHGVCRPAARGHATVSQAFLRDRLRLLQRRAHARGVLVTIGARYPAAHASNVMQLLTARHADDPEPLLRRLAMLAERVEAVQLELGIPLRWRGPQRAAFVETLVDVLTESPTAAVVPLTGDDTHAATLDRRAETTLTFPVLGCGGKPTTRVGMQVASGPVAVFGSIDAGPAGATAGRLLITDAAERLALFTGELVERGPSLHVPALCIEADDDDALDLRFAGPMLAFPVLTPFTDLERGLAAGTLIDADVHLRLTPTAPGTHLAPGAVRFGTVRGIVRLGDASHRLDASGAASEGLPAPAPRPNVRLVLPGTPRGDLDLRSHTVTEVAGDPARPFATAFRFEIDGTAWSGPQSTPLRGVADVHLRDATIRIRIDGEGQGAADLDATLDRPIPVRRPGPAGTVIETVFALCRIPNAPTGWLELTVDRGADDD